MTPNEKERLEMLLRSLQQSESDPFSHLLLEIDALRSGLPVESDEYYHLEIALKHLLICKYRLPSPRHT